MIKINKLKLKNILSYKKLELSFDDSKVIIIKSKDNQVSNGVGKSALFEAIFFALYGKTIRGCSSIGRKGETEYEINIECVNTKTGNKIEIVRGFKNDKKYLEIYLNEKRSNKDLTVRKSQEMIDSIYGNYNTFSFRIMSPGMINFMDCNASDKLNILLRYFNIDFSKYYARALKDFKKGVQDYESSVDILNTYNKNRESLLTSLKTYKEARSKTNIIIEKENNQLRKLESKKEELQKLIERLTEEESFDALKDKYFKLESRIKERKDRIAAKKLEISNFQKNIDNIEKSKEKTTCPSCFQPVNISVLKDVVTDLILQKDSKCKDIKNLDNQLQEYLKRLRQCNDKILEIENLNEKLENIKKEISVIQKNISKYGSTYKEEIESLQLKLNKIKPLITKNSKILKESKLIVECLEEWKISLGSSGIKHKFLQTFLDVLNSRMSYYLSLFFSKSVKSNFRIENSKIEFDAQGLQYDNMSSGERKRVSLSFAFSLSDFSNFGIRDIGFRFFDECFDSLDISGIKNVMNILKNLPDIQNFIISHNENFDASTTPYSVIRVEKIDSVSKASFR